MAENPSGAAGGDPSMDEILASIRRILSDEEKAAKAKQPDDGVLRLDPSMLVETPEHEASPPGLASAQAEPAPIDEQSFDEMMREATRAGAAEMFAPAAPEPPAPEPAVAEAPAPEPAVREPPSFALPPEPEPESPALTPATVLSSSESLIAPETAAMAASAVGTLMKTLAAERNSAVYRGGPTIEDVVRAEIRPLLKAWLDQHLPGMVERFVRAEIERVVGRAAG